MSGTCFRIGLVVAAVLAARPAWAQAPPPARTLELAFHADSTVTLSAAQVTVREILAEWARQCGCYVVNSDKLAGAPLEVPIRYDHERQDKVLGSLLRQAAGFVLTPKRAGAATASNYETIYILATSAPVAGAAVPPPAATSVAAPISPIPDPAAIAAAETGAAVATPAVMPPATAAQRPTSGATLARPGTPSAFIPMTGIATTRPAGAGSPGMQTPEPIMVGGAPVIIPPRPIAR